MTAARVLVVDDDPWTQRMVSAVLRAAGFEVDLASDGWEALIYADRVLPDLIITEVKLPTTDGWALVEALRKRHGASALPVIYLAGAGARAIGSGFLNGIDQVLAKPFRLDQLEHAIDNARRQSPSRAPGAAASTPPAAAPALRVVGWNEEPPTPAPFWSAGEALEDARPPGHLVLSGVLAEFGLSSLLIVLELERKTGVLALAATGGTPLGRVWLRAGRAIRADLDGPENRRNAPAIYAMLDWSAGTFDFLAGEVAGDDEINASTSFLLMEGARLADERKHAKSGSD
jgi:CheY-like chemotaxis protein